MEEKYKEIRLKHKLPEFSIMDQEFEISDMEESHFLMRKIRERVVEKIEFTLKIFDSVLHPEEGFGSYRESAIFVETDKDGILHLYRRLMYFARTATELSFADSDDLNAAFIRDFMKEWPELKKSVLVYVRRMKDSWMKDLTKKDVVGYLG